MRRVRLSLAALLAVWLVSSMLATALAPHDPWLALAVGGACGAWFGWQSARLVDPVRMRVGRRRRPGPPTEA